MQTVRAFPPVQRLTIAVRGERNLKNSPRPNLLKANLSPNRNLTVCYVTPVRLLLSCGFLFLRNTLALYNRGIVRLLVEEVIVVVL